MSVCNSLIAKFDACRLQSISCVLIVFVGSLALSTLVDTKAASAQSRQCINLERQLRSVQNASISKRSSSITARYSKAIRSQKKQIRKVDSMMSRYGCRKRKVFFQRSKHPRCTPLRSQRKRMMRNLGSLESKGRSLSGGNPRSRARLVSRIKRNMARARCGTTFASLRTIAGSTADEQARSRSAKLKRLKRERKRASAEESLKNYNTFRTMCVRSCDGYYFPVSFSTKQSKFGRDASACNNLCPGADMRLYFHRTTGETVENMVSAQTGKLYTELPRAFSYRKSYNPSCSCNYKLLNRDKNVVAKKKTRTRDAKSKSQVLRGIAMPSFRVDQGQDPETLMTMRGGFTLDQASSLVTKTAEPEAKVARRVRVIGEEFFPTQ